MSEGVRATEGFEILSDSAEPRVSYPGMTTRVARGTLWTLGGQCTVILASLIATPFIVRRLGPEAYGVYALVNVLIGYLAFTDLGMGVTATRFGADAHARVDEPGEVAVVWTSTLIAVVPAAFSAIVLAFFAAPLVDFVLRMPTSLREESILAIRLACLGFVARTTSGVLNAPQVVRLRMDLNTVVTSGLSIAQFCLITTVLLLGGGLVGSVSAVACISVATVIVHLLISRRLLPRLLHPRIDPTLIKPLLRFGGGLAASALAAMVLVNVEKLLLPRFASVTALAHYAVAYSVAGMLAIVPGAMRQSLLPAFTYLQSQSDRETLARLYARALRGSLLWIAPVSVLLCVCAKPFFTLWAGPEFGQQSTIPFYILVVGLLFNVMAYVPYTLLMACGRSDLIARFHLAEVLPYIACAALLIYSMGAMGAAVAWSLRVAADSFLFFLAARRVAGFSTSRLLSIRGMYLIAMAVLVLPLIALLISLSQTALLSVTVVCFLLYGGLVWFLVLTSEERAWVNAIARSARITLSGV